MRSFFLGLCLAVLPVFTWNLVSDPLGILKDFRQLMPLKKNQILVGRNINERIVKRDLLGVTRDIDIAILGTSRAGIVSSDHFPGRNFLNLSVEGATAADYLYFLNEFDGSRNFPKELIVEIAPWTFSKNEKNSSAIHDFEKKQSLYRVWRWIKASMSIQTTKESMGILLFGEQGAGTRGMALMGPGSIQSNTF